MMISSINTIDKLFAHYIPHVEANYMDDSVYEYLIREQPTLLVYCLIHKSNVPSKYDLGLINACNLPIWTFLSTKNTIFAVLQYYKNRKTT